MVIIQENNNMTNTNSTENNNSSLSSYEYYDKYSDRNEVRFDHTSHKLRMIRRNNNGSKFLSRAARILASHLDRLLEKSLNGIIFVTHEFITNITDTARRQNNNILKELDHIFTRKYKRVVKIDGVIKRDGLVISYREDGKDMLNNPKKYFKSLEHKKSERVIPERVISCISLYKEEKNINKEDRSRANFCKNVDKLENTEPPLPEQQPQPKPEYRRKPDPKILNDFYPLTEELAEELRTASGRNFSLNAMNEILKDIAKRLTHCIFYSIKGFKAYMAKLLKNELRDENKVNNETFRITANLTEEDKKAMEIEKYLTEIENNREVSQEMHLKKKLANVLKPATAYELLRNYKDINIKNDIAEITLKNHVELTELEKDIVLSQVKATHETLINGVFTPIMGIKYTVVNKPVTFTTRAMNMISRTGIWGNIRSKIAEYLGKDGDAIDTNIFSKLEAEIDEQNKQIKLKAPINHLKVMVEDTYAHEIRSAAESIGFTFKEIYC